jgi:hypothetical protein
VHSKVNGNPFPEMWTLIVNTTTGPRLVEPRNTEALARQEFSNYQATLAAGVSVTSAYIIPPDGDGEIIRLVGSVPAHA